MPLSQHLLDDVSANILQTFIAALVEVGQHLVVQAHQVQQRGVGISRICSVVRSNRPVFDTEIRYSAEVAAVTRHNDGIVC